LPPVISLEEDDDDIETGDCYTFCMTPDAVVKSFSHQLSTTPPTSGSSSSVLTRSATTATNSQADDLNSWPEEHHRSSEEYEDDPSQQQQAVDDDDDDSEEEEDLSAVWTHTKKSRDDAVTTTTQWTPFDSDPFFSAWPCSRHDRLATSERLVGVVGCSSSSSKLDRDDAKAVVLAESPFSIVDFDEALDRDSRCSSSRYSF
jgi:hypothetical protein